MDKEVTRGCQKVERKREWLNRDQKKNVTPPLGYVLMRAREMVEYVCVSVSVCVHCVRIVQLLVQPSKPKGFSLPEGRSSHTCLSISHSQSRMGRLVLFSAKGPLCRYCSDWAGYFSLLQAL